ncbi:MAG: helix-turn-helix transcriptional regulator [Prochloraceae cyanobacterium]|nr:helix-turn-helix transcriptional regulator [Prochloraceae cyanobacterium]
MSLQERKEKFTKLLQDLLDERDGVKGKLAKELAISPATFTHWLQGKVDPAGLDIVTFQQVAKLKGYSIEKLAQFLGFIEVENESQVRFRKLIEELLLDQTQEELANILQVNQATISRWLKADKVIDLKKIPVKTMFSLAREKNWTFDKLFNYLKLQSNNKVNNRFQLNQQKDCTICIILEKEDIALATNYASNLVLHFHLQPDNITIATPLSIPESLSFFDVLLFDLNNQQSPCIPLIESLQFDGDVVAFVDRSLPQDIQDRLKEKATDVIVKPVPWSELKQKTYFFQPRE